MLKLAFHPLTVVTITASFRWLVSESTIVLIRTGQVVVEIVAKSTTTTGSISIYATIVVVTILVRAWNIISIVRATSEFCLHLSGH